LVEATIDSGFTQYNPNKLIGDKAYDSNKLDQRLPVENNVEMVAPHRRGRKRPKTQDGRKLRPYRPVESGAPVFLAPEFQAYCGSV
jgi:hypothetical protein